MTREEAITYLEDAKHNLPYKYGQALDMATELLSADAMPTVIRSRTLLPTKDFKEWAKRIKEVNPNAVVIPCDAQVASADAVHGEWQKVEEQPYFRKHYDTVCCSVCRKKGDRKWNYCPNCGARMKGGDPE